MNRLNIPEPDPDKLLKKALKDDIPPEVEAGMNRQFLSLKNTLNRAERLPESDGWFWMRGPFRKEILAVTSAVMLILGIVMHPGDSQSALAHSIERLKVMVTVSMNLNRTVFMDCTIMKPEAGGGNTSYHLLWRAEGDVRVDRISADGAQTIWISDETISFAGPGGGSIRSMPLQTMAPGSVWQPAMEFRTPALLAKHLEERYGLMQTVERNGVGSGEFLIMGREDGQAVEITVDARTYLPKALRKYAPDSGLTNGDRVCLTEVRFLWNRPISGELFVPGPVAGKQ